MYSLSNLAADDFAAIYEYTLLHFGVVQADAYTEHLENTFRKIRDTPRISRNNVQGNGTLIFAERAGFKNKVQGARFQVQGKPGVLDQRVSAFISVQRF
jgi:plasmid stabilization system protein ParE